MDDPIIGRTHTDLFKTRGRLTSIGGKNGLKLTYFSADGFSYGQIAVFVAAVVVWTLPLSRLGVPWFALGGMSTALLIGPPIALAWAADRTLPNNKSLKEWLTTRYRHNFREKKHYAAGKPITTMTITTASRIWSPAKEGIDG